MQFFAALVSLFALGAIDLGVDARSFRPSIVGGGYASAGEVPFQVWVRQMTSAINARVCGGILYKPNKVLTAAHCVIPNDGPVYIRYGTHDIQAPKYSDIKASHFVQHEGYNPQGNIPENDVAVVTLSQSIKEDSVVKYAKLQTSYLNPGQQVTVYGWGVTSWEGELSQKLKKATLRIKDSSSAKHIVAQADGTIACSGDSGGSMVSSDGKAAGVASAVTNYCPAGGLNFYTRISAYITWINSK